MRGEWGATWGSRTPWGCWGTQHLGTLVHRLRSTALWEDSVQGRFVRVGRAGAGLGAKFKGMPKSLVIEKLIF